MINGLVSVIMPSWNTGKYIAESIQSVFAQTYDRWELLIVDDHSTDNTDDIVRPFLEDSRVRYLKNDRNCGAALTRNRAIREVRGEWIAFLDSDDLWMPEKLEKQVAFMNEHGFKFSYTEYERIDENGRPLNITVTGPAVVDRKKIYRYDYIGQLTMMYNAKHFGLIQIEDIKKNNDYAIRLQLFKTPGAEAYLLKEILAQYRIRKKSISHDKLSRKLRSHYDLFHICDKKTVPASLWCTFRNMWYGTWKKINYEKRIK